MQTTERDQTDATEFWRDPAMPYVESRRACHSRACYKPHSHPTFSIGAVDAGISHFTGAAQGPVAIGAGTVVFVPAATVHACNPAPGQAWSYQMLHVDAAWFEQVLAESQDSASTKFKPTQALLAHDPAVYARFCRLNALLFSAASVAASAEKEAALIEFIGDLGLAGADLVVLPTQPVAGRHQLQPVLDCLHDASAEARAMVDLAEMAVLASMSRYQLIRAFRAATGMTPHAYQLNLSINRARVWLRSTGKGAGMADIADIAYRLGFADQSHFQRVFKAHAGVTPGLYRA